MKSTLQYSSQWPEHNSQVNFATSHTAKCLQCDIGSTANHTSNRALNTPRMDENAQSGTHQRHNTTVSRILPANCALRLAANSQASILHRRHRLYVPMQPSKRRGDRISEFRRRNVRSRYRCSKCLQFAFCNAASCALHRSMSRVIHRLE